MFLEFLPVNLFPNTVMIQNPIAQEPETYEKEQTYVVFEWC